MSITTVPTTVVGEVVATPTVPVKRAMPFEMSTPDDIDSYVKVLFYGPPGSGKTYLAGTAQNVEAMRDVIVLDIEGGKKSLRRPRFKGITTVRIKDTAGFQQIFAYLRAHAKMRDANNVEGMRKAQQQVTQAEVTGEPKRFRTIVIDSLSEVQKLIMYNITGVNIETYQIDQDVPQPQFAEWGKNAERVRLLVRKFRDLDYNVIFVAAERVKTENGRTNKSISLPGQLSGEVPYFLDLVGYLMSFVASVEGQPEGGKAGNTVRRLYITPGLTYEAKNRFGATDKFIENPDMQKIWDLQLLE